MKPVYLDEPNLVVPLAASYNIRGQDGFTQSITNASDQRKVNSIYEPVKNQITDKTTLYLVKRPGVSSVATCGNTNQIAYLHEQAAGGVEPWVFNIVSTSTNRVSSSTSTVAVTTLAGFQPAYVDKTEISGVDTVVLQLRATSTGTQRTYTTSTIAAWGELTDSVFTGLNHQGKMEQMDGFGFIAARSPNRIYNSAINNLSSWPVLNYLTRRAQQDIHTGLGRLGSQILSWGANTLEVYQNSGSATGSQLEQLPVLSHDVGLADQSTSGGRHYYGISGGYLYWVSGNPIGCYAYTGQRVEKVSNVTVDKILASRTALSVSRLTFNGQRAIAICLDVVTAATQRALLFFPEWNDWFEWDSTVFITQTGMRSTNLYLGVGANQHKVYRVLDGTNNWIDEATHYTMTHQFKMPTKGNEHRRLQMFGLKGDTAASNTTSALNVRFSFDDWQTSTAARTIDMTKAVKRITRCGGYSDLGVYLDHTGNLDCRLEAVVARIE